MCLIADYLGSIIAITNNSGSVQNVNSYDNFGIADQGNLNRFGYTGQIYLSELKLNYYKARIYHPKLGRFLQTDPVGYEDQMNLYAYVHNDPINMNDPSGKVAKFVKSAFNVVRNASRNGWDFKKAGKDEIASFVDNVSTLADGQFTADDVVAAIDIVTGFGGEAEKLGKSLNKFAKKVPANSKNNMEVQSLPDGGVAVQATSPASNIPGSKAVYEKQIDSSGTTVQATKTTYAPNGDIVHVKDKMTGEEFN